MKVFETERLILRRLSIQDAAFILELLNDPAFLRFIGDKGVRTPEDARDYIVKEPIDSYDRLGFGIYLTELKTDQLPIGICGLGKKDFLRDVHIGFAFLPQFRSKGFAFEAACAVMTYGRDGLGLNRIVAVVAPDNERSIHLLGKLGLRFERMLRWPEDGSEVKLFASGV